jgi:hypothetical protein
LPRHAACTQLDCNSRAFARLPLQHLVLHAGFGPGLDGFGRLAEHGMAQAFPNRFAPGMRPSASNLSTCWRVQPHFSAACIVVSISRPDGNTMHII